MFELRKEASPLDSIPASYSNKYNQGKRLFSASKSMFGIWSLGQKRLFFRHFPDFFSHVAPLCSFKNLKTDEKIARFCLKHQIPNML
jgi:hypothetical protein